MNMMWRGNSTPPPVVDEAMSKMVRQEKTGHLVSAGGYAITILAVVSMNPFLAVTGVGLIVVGKYSRPAILRRASARKRKLAKEIGSRE